MARFVHRSRIEASAREVFEWHKRPGAFERLLPPWERVEVVERCGGIADGDRATIRTAVGPLWTQWIVEHRDYREGEQFRDVQIVGPFHRWEHTHRVIPDGSAACILEDDIRYELPLGWLGRILGGRSVASKLHRMFTYRHAVTRADLQAHQASAGRDPLRIVVSGSSGLIGSNLIPLLTTGGQTVVRLSRRSGQSNACWDTDTGRITIDSAERIGAVVHLAGENIAGRWSKRKKRLIRDSRVRSTEQIAEWIQRLDEPPHTLICASAIGYYGDCGDEIVCEEHGAGRSFLSEVCAAWESAAQRALSEQTRVVSLRFGVVLSPRGGALAKMLRPFKFGGGGIVGNGRQFWSWISVDDAAGAILHVLHDRSLSGPVNVVAPNPVTNREFTKALGATLCRPTIMPIPRTAARVAFGEMAEELLLASQRVKPTRLQETGYVFRHPRLVAALGHLLGKPESQ